MTPVLWQGGGGIYGFTTSGHRCVEVDVEAQRGLTIDTECRIDASGTYNNIVCGTGTTGGGVLGRSDFGIDTNSDGEVTSFLYGITFVGMIGILSGTQLPEPDGGTGAIVGVVQINATPLRRRLAHRVWAPCVAFSSNVHGVVTGVQAN